MQRLRAALFLLGLSIAFVGCSSFGRKGRLDYRTIKADPHHDTDRAKAENLRAIKFIEKGKLDKAETALQEALIADVGYGPAHNNLGKLYYSQGKYYLAAWEFEYAIRLMPQRPECQNNLGLVYEAVGKLDQAIECYAAAREMDPKNAVFLGNLARAQMCRGGDPFHIKELLQELKLYDSRPDWVGWANEQLAVGPLAALPQHAVYTEPQGPVFPAPVAAPPQPAGELVPPPTPNGPKPEELPPPFVPPATAAKRNAAASMMYSSRRTANRQD